MQDKTENLERNMESTDLDTKNLEVDKPEADQAEIANVEANNIETDNLETMKDYMRWGASQFMQAELSFTHGMVTAIDEAVYLVLRSLHLPVDTPDVYWDGRLTHKEKQTVKNLLQQRIETRKPAARCPLDWRGNCVGGHFRPRPELLNSEWILSGR